MVTRPTRALPEYVVENDVARMLAACDNDRDRLLVELLWRTGGRISEVLSIRVRDITKYGLTMPNLKQGRFRKVDTGKRNANGEPIFAKIHESVKEQKQVIVSQDFLDRLREQTKQMPGWMPLISRHVDGKPITRQRAWQIITTIGRRAGVSVYRFSTGEERPPHPHCLRHANAVHLLEHGVTLPAVQSQLGHKNLNNTAIYLRIADPHRRDMINQVKF